MAGTRRQPRARDTTYTQQHRRSVSQVASSIVPETAISTKANVLEIAQSVDRVSPRPGSSPHPETPVSRSTTAFCKKCNSKVGEFYNLWHKVTSSYYSPALIGSYRSLLRNAHQRREASNQTELAGCTIDLASCPSCDECLGFIIIDAPVEAKRFRDREFFKLQRIELRCEISPNRTIAVEPQEDTAPDPVVSEGSIGPSPGPDDTATDTMDLDTPLSSSHPLWTQPTQGGPQQLHQPLQPREPLGQPRQPDGPQPPAAISRSPTSRSGTTPATAPATLPPSASPQPAQPRAVNAIGSSAIDIRPESVAEGRHDGYSYPHEPREVYFDAIQRLQTQTAQNTSALAAQSRNQIDYTEIVRQTEGNLRHEFQTQLHRQDQEFRRLDEVVGRLVQELQDCRRTIVDLVQEVNATRTESARRPIEVAQPGYQDEALELMARHIGDVSHRTTNLESLRDQVAIMGGRVQRLETESAAVHNPHSRPPPPTHQLTHPAHVAHTVPSHSNHGGSFQAPPQLTSISQSIPHHEKSVAAMPAESAQRHEPTPHQSGWATVNAGVKRVHEDGTNTPHRSASSTPGSPKRPRLVTGDSQEAPPMAQIPPGPPHILASQAQSLVASPPPPQPQPGFHPGSHPGIHPGTPSSQAYSPFGTQDGPSDQSWRPESQRVTERPVRGRGSRGGRGPGSRGGRVQKSMQGQQHPAGSPDWERDSWSALPDSQASPIVVEDHTPARSIVRRGGGGGGPRGPKPRSSMERANKWTPEIGPRSVYRDSPSVFRDPPVFHDPPSETKKTRSKPIRNEEGILVRKDGRPDRRSQSSAANLRKVHARKEEQQREGEAGSTPNGLHLSMSTGPDTPTPPSRGYPEQNVTDSVRKKHRDILGRIFPDGIDTSRKQNDYAHQVFNEDRDHTAHPRAQSSRTAKLPPQIKNEHVEHIEVAETRTATDGDVTMEDARSSANDHIQNNTPTLAGQLVESPERENLQNQDQTSSEQESRVQVPETQATEGSATLAAESVEAR